MLYFVQIVASVCVFIGWFAILFTGKLPEGLAGVPVLQLRYQTRVTTYGMFLQEEYPPFEFETEGTDPGDYPRMRVDMAPGARPTGTALTVFFRYLLVHPAALRARVRRARGGDRRVHRLVRGDLHRPSGPTACATSCSATSGGPTRVNGYAFLLTDEYPPFTTR